MDTNRRNKRSIKSKIPTGDPPKLKLPSATNDEQKKDGTQNKKVNLGIESHKKPAPIKISKISEPRRFRLKRNSRPKDRGDIDLSEQNTKSIVPPSSRNDGLRDDALRQTKPIKSPSKRKDIVMNISDDVEDLELNPSKFPKDKIPRDKRPK
ncbi:MAG: hypothetical protein OEZ01_12200, partial [Candidatus Heimdallarchaeota archaeon]|nr:hypothetical protein [Candidatus Heimdallarchaeota archaeon]MDH5646766.1 hypothetical protein [Candidatus Heimdallarchaeota archaeon]